MSRALTRVTTPAALPVLLLVTWWFASAGSQDFYRPPLRTIVRAFPDTWTLARFEHDVLPSLTRLEAVAVFGATLIAGGHRVLCHCGLGFNRSALVAGVILHKLGMPGAQAVDQIRSRRPGALFNEVFANYLLSLPAALSDERVRRAP